MKLNAKRTILVGFAFFLINVFWQAYDSTIPVILTNQFGMSQTWSGVIMAADNILALFMLPLFGMLSDRCHTRFGRRTPFIVIGTLVAAVALMGLSLADNAQRQTISDVLAIDDPAALAVIYDSQGEKQLMTPDGETFVLSACFTRDEFTQIVSRTTDVKTGGQQTNPDYTSYVVPARQAWVGERTAQNPGALRLFMVFLIVILIAMSTFRSPAVALMPDITVKPLRSKGNAIINLMGCAGGILVLVLGMLFSTSALENAMMCYTVFYSIVSGIMLLALAIFVLTVKERDWAEQMRIDSISMGIDETQTEGVQRSLSTGEKRSLGLILASIALWYFGYNAVTSKYSVYAGNILHKDYNTTMLLAQAAAIVSYLPAGSIASKIGRKKTILIGVALLAIAFGTGALMRAESPDWMMNTIFVLAGVAWATINVNSFPMVVEMCSGADVGKYTGFYYTASMAAQIVTPMISGALMDQMGMTVLFPYATIFVIMAFVTMMFVRHGDGSIQAKKGLDAFDVGD